MTREEQIKQASIEYTMINVPMCIGGNAFPEIIDEMNRNHAFEEGAKWADEHPKSPWISVNENLPPVEKYDMSIMVLALNTEGKINFSKYDYDAEEWISPVLDIVFTHWMPIPKLP